MIRSVSPRMAQYINKKISQSDPWEPVLRQYITKLKSGFWENDYVNSCFQLTHGNIDIYAAYCFAHFHAWISVGKILIATVEIGVGPEGDSKVVENNGALAHLPEPFSGEFVGGPGGPDGYIKWNRIIELGQIDCTGREIAAMIKPRSVPLEVGLTRPDTTIYRLLEEDGLARWPYCSESIYLFVRNPNWPKNVRN